MLVDELNMSSCIPGELRCGEYSFKLKMNPWQHPIFDKNTYHLLALLTSLRYGCGGVIYLMVDSRQTVTDEIFHIYKKRLYTLLSKNMECFHLPTHMFQVSLVMGSHRSWAAVLLTLFHGTLKYTPMETMGIWKQTSFEIDIFGQLHILPPTDTQSQSDKGMQRSSLFPSQESETLTLLPACSQNHVPTQTETVTSAPYATAPVTVPGHSDDTVIPKVDFSSCPRLDWTENKKDWQKYVKIKEIKTADIAASCPMWQTTQPMKVTPDRDSLRYLFECEKDMDETLSAVATEKPGCAVVCRTWRFHISHGIVPEDLPPGHICDILTVTDTGTLTFWVVVDSFDEETFHSQIEYLMKTGRMLKYQIVRKGKGDDLSNLWIDCRLHSLVALSSTEKAVTLILSESQEMQAHLNHINQAGLNFVSLQRALTKIIISKESPLKRRVGEHTSITLSVQQAEVLMHKAKVNYITGPAGSGKSYTGAFLYKMHGKERSVYICTTKEFLEYLKYNGCEGTLVASDQDLLREIKSGTFENKICVVIDDCHNFTCTKKSMSKLFKVLKKNRHMTLFVFADNDYQSFDRKRQETVHDAIFNLTRKVLQDFPLIFRLTDIYRNTRKVVSFVQSAIQDIHDGHQTIESANLENGEGVECITIPSLWENIPDNDLVAYLRSLLSSERYRQSEVAILLESAYTPDEIKLCKQILAEHIPSVIVQSADVFPQAGVIVDSVNSFLGLDANVCVFILSTTQKRSSHPLRRILKKEKMQFQMNMYNPRYKVFLASRAIHKAVFVVPELHEELVHQMKFDHFQVCVYESN